MDQNLKYHNDLIADLYYKYSSLMCFLSGKMELLFGLIDIGQRNKARCENKTNYTVRN